MNTMNIYDGNIRQQTDLCQDVLVKVGLKSTHFHPKDAFALRGQLSEDVLLKSTKHERLELLVQVLDLLLMVCIGEIEFV